MIHGMSCPRNEISAAVSCMLFLSSLLGAPNALLARPGTLLDHQSTPELSVRIYSFSGMSEWMLTGAETEAKRMLNSVSLKLRWVDCTSSVMDSECFVKPQYTDLIVRILPKALPGVSISALGITDYSDNEAASFVFYDRIAALRTHTNLVPSMLGRVMAHEIGHLLLRGQKHSDVGLMRPQWSSDDLRVVSSGCLGMPVKSVQLIRNEVLRRVLSAGNRIQR